MTRVKQARFNSTSIFMTSSFSECDDKIYFANTVCLRGRVYADEYDLGFVNTFVYVCAKVEILAAALFHNFFQTRLLNKIVFIKIINKLLLQLLLLTFKFVI